MSGKPGLAILFRYGAGEHLHFLPALPELMEDLSRDFTVHHIGFRGEERVPESLRRHARLHELPLRVRRKSEPDKRWKALCWSLLLPWLGLILRLKKVQVVFIDETLPLSAFALRLAYRGIIVQTVHDFFLEIYFPPGSRGHRLGTWLQQVDLRTWKRIQGIFTRVEATRDYLITQGLRPERIHVAHDPCDLQLFAPRERAAARAAWGFSPEDVVMVHHGVMHPNKGNDRILRALARLRHDLPRLKFLLIGEGPASEALDDLILELGLSGQVRRTGWLGSMQEVAHALNAADIGLVMRVGQPGDHFHVTSTLVHNLATGLPVLAARLDGIQEIVTEDREALLFDPVCDAEFDQKLRRLTEDPALRLRLGCAARATAEDKFDRNHIAASMADALRQCGKPAS